MFLMQTWYTFNITHIPAMDQSNSNSAFELLPEEIKYIILVNLSNVKTLRALLCASPLFRRTYRTAPDVVLTHLTLRELAARNIDLLVLQDAHACEVSMRSDKGSCKNCSKIMATWTYGPRGNVTWVDRYRNDNEDDSNDALRAPPRICEPRGSVCPTGELKYALCNIKRQLASPDNGVLLSPLSAWYC